MNGGYLFIKKNFREIFEIAFIIGLNAHMKELFVAYVQYVNNITLLFFFQGNESSLPMELCSTCK